MIEDVGTWDTWDINTLTKSCAAFTSGRSVNPGQGAFLGEETLPFSCCLSGTGVYGISTPENIGENLARFFQDRPGWTQWLTLPTNSPQVARQRVNRQDVV